MIAGRPVARRASLRAASIASEPEFRKKIVSIGSGRVSASIVASFETGSVKPIAPVGPISRSAWAWIAAVTAGWWWPRVVTAMPFAKSR